ncbi:hypothetical protein ABW21_db0205276 [Orbilia brochopaga]|nr:hypothetical protein ABW21_db0205276 [Drechslerella brochopaga]
MSGAEIIGLIAGILGIAEVVGEIYRTAKDAESLPKAFSDVAQRLPLLQNTLKKAEDQLKARNLTTNEEKEIKPIIVACEENAKDLKRIFEAVVPLPGASRTERYCAAARALGKKGRVESLMKGMLERVQDLVNNHTIRAATEEQIKELSDAINAMAKLPPSVPDSVFDKSAPHNVHWGSGSINDHSGTGDINNHTGSGYFFNGQNMNFGFIPGGKSGPDGN